MAGWITTPIVQVALAFKLNVAVVGQDPIPAAVVERANGALKATAMPVTWAVLVLVSVTCGCSVTLVVPTKASPKFSSPVGLTLRSTLTPVPFSATGEPVTVLLAVIVTDPVTAPAAVGANCTMIVQDAP
jgi:hypothetical protein